MVVLFIVETKSIQNFSPELYPPDGATDCEFEHLPCDQDHKKPASPSHHLAVLSTFVARDATLSCIACVSSPARSPPASIQVC